MDALTKSGEEGRGVAAISFGEVLSNLWSGDFRMGKPDPIKIGSSRLQGRDADLGKWNISVPRGAKNNGIAFCNPDISLVAASEKEEAQTAHHIACDADI